MHVGEDGVILVDSGSAAMADAARCGGQGITRRPIRMIINTSADADHVGGNDRWAPRASTINPDCVQRRAARHGARA